MVIFILCICVHACVLMPAVGTTVILFIGIWLPVSFFFERAMRPSIAQPSRYPEIDRLVDEYLAGFDPIDKTHFDLTVRKASTEHMSRGASVIVQVIGHNIYVDRTTFSTLHAWDRQRLQHILWLLKRMLLDEEMPDFEMIVNVHDCPLRDWNMSERVPVFTMTRCIGQRTIPLPQWFRKRDGQWGPDWDTFVRNQTPGPGKANKMPKAVFRGAFRPSVLHSWNGSLHFVDIGPHNWHLVGRTRLLWLAEQQPDLFDIGLQSSSSTEWRLISQVSRLNNGTRLGMKQQAANFQYVLHVEGACGWADRLRWFLALGARILKQEAVCEEFFAPLLRPYIHYIPIDNGLTNVIAAMSDDTSQDIELNAQQFAQKYLTSMAWEYYFRTLVRRYARELWDGRIALSRRPGSMRFVREAPCGKQISREGGRGGGGGGECDDSAAYEI